jgi:ribosomal protein L29
MPVPHHLSRKFQDTLGTEASDAMTDWMNEVDTQFAEVRREIAELRVDMRADMAELRHGVHREITTLREEVHREIATLLGEVRGEVTTLRQDMTKQFADVDARFAEVKVEFADVRQEMRVGFAQVNAKMDTRFTASEAAAERRHADFMKWTMGFWAASLITMMGGLAALARMLR